MGQGLDRDPLTFPVRDYCDPWPACRLEKTLSRNQPRPPGGRGAPCSPAPACSADRPSGGLVVYVRFGPESGAAKMSWVAPLVRIQTENPMNLRNGHLLVMLLFCVGFFALAEEPGTSPDFVGGTCVVVAWRGDMFGVAADARETVFGSGEIDNVCKMRSPARGVLLTVTGVEEIRGGGKVAWSGLDEATSIFSAIGPGTSLTDEQLM